MVDTTGGYFRVEPGKVKANLRPVNTNRTFLGVFDMHNNNVFSILIVEWPGC